MKNSLKKKISNRYISFDATLIAALKQMDKIERKLLLVFNKEKFINLLSIGDIQRAIIQNKPLDTQVLKVLRSETKFGYISDSTDVHKKRLFEYRSECLPIVNNQNELEEVIFWEDIFGPKENTVKKHLNIPVVIMAGGRGSRMKPITNVIPKPLIPFGTKTIIENIMDKFIDVGCNNFHLSVNYKADTIKHYFQQLNNLAYKIDYFQEEKPLGTAGSLFLLKNKIDQTFFISNCDIIIDEDYIKIYNYHQQNNNELTIVAALKNYSIPYGTIESGNNGVLKSLQEKPEVTFKINSGMYILEPHLLNEVPKNEFFHITHLIENIQKRKGKVGVFPVSEGSWTDIGEWSEYLKMI